MAVQNLLESYKNRLAISESIHQQSHNGAKMGSAKKVMIATVLNNTAKFLNEAFTQSAATQRSSLGDFKKFCLNISTIALPNLILPELMITKPMTSFSGFITYLNYQAGATKGSVTAGDTFNNPWSLGDVTEGRINYSGQVVVEDNIAVTVSAGTSETKETGTFATTALSWNPVLDVKSVKDSAGTLSAFTFAVNGTTVTLTANENGAGTIPESVKVAYVYDNVTIPQTNTPNALPTLTAKMEVINLQAQVRRLAIYYNQLAAFQAKTDYGFDLGDQLSQQAQGELAFEIDSEGVNLLADGAEADTNLTFQSWEAWTGNNTVTISRSQYYEGLSEVIARAKKIIYDNKSSVKG